MPVVVLAAAAVALAAAKGKLDKPNGNAEEAAAEAAGEAPALPNVLNELLVAAALLAPASSNMQAVSDQELLDCFLFLGFWGLQITPVLYISTAQVSVQHSATLTEADMWLTMVPSC